MRGRKQKPFELQRAEGDPRQRGKGKLDEKIASQIEPTRGLPQAPEHLYGIALEVWNFWSAELVKMNIDRRPDAIMLEGACVAYQAAVRAYTKAAELGDVVEEPVVVDNKIVGYKLKKNPWVVVREGSWAHVKAFCSEFGLSPISRQRIQMDKAESGDDDLAEILSRPRKKDPVN